MSPRAMLFYPAGVLGSAEEESMSLGLAMSCESETSSLPVVMKTPKSEMKNATFDSSFDFANKSKNAATVPVDRKGRYSRGQVKPRKPSFFSRRALFCKVSSENFLRVCQPVSQHSCQHAECPRPPTLRISLRKRHGAAIHVSKRQSVRPGDIARPARRSLPDVKRHPTSLVREVSRCLRLLS
jgi:hypothetical protein